MRDLMCALSITVFEVVIIQVCCAKFVVELNAINDGNELHFYMNFRLKYGSGVKFTNY